MKPKKPPQVSAYIVTGKKKTELVIMNWTRETRANLKPFAMPSERHIRTGQPDGIIRDGSTEELICKAMVHSGPYLVNGRVNYPDWIGKTLSVNRRRYTITETNSEEIQGFIRFEIKAVRYTNEFQIIHFR